MSFVILTDIIQTVLETSECFQYNTNNNMHILATGTDEQAVYSGHLSSKLLDTAPAAIRSFNYCPVMITPFNENHYINHYVFFVLQNIDILSSS